jgi:hypothetical protein
MVATMGEGEMKSKLMWFTAGITTVLIIAAYW